ncbi:16S rRNA (guanine(966)-N(2))-methyltransferase RsmD [Rathayibacter soli]|uniref:16S rRNA (guanine(966)-N(2))-methyltransferase RsmD n=1 Tax=Rathayibacter soli TaxID=3144168 RepID=UPI0027E5A7AE|nr:16S rRNA (guanine(966)-N(2))-methyltransferase RsmD [Glaciibacter superstes]
MTRIVSGFAGSLTLAVPRSGTRPTSDRVREAMFSALVARNAVHDANVLDLYAGSGALGLEAASRGAASVVLVERSRAAAEICRANASAILTAAKGRAAPRLSTVVSSVRGFLAGHSAAAGGFQLVFLDPPYDLPERELTEDLATLEPLLTDDAVVVVERSARSQEPTWPPLLTLDRRKVYGDTAVWTADRIVAE